MTVAGTPDVIVVGGGLIGAVTAFTLSRAGLRVTVLDADRPGAAWRAAAGLLTPDGERLRGTPLHAPALSGLRAWPELARALEAASGVNVAYRPGVTRLRPGGGEDRTPGEASLYPPGVVQAARHALPVVRARVTRLTPLPGTGVRVHADAGDGTGDRVGTWDARHVILAAGAWSGAFGLPVQAQWGQAHLHALPDAACLFPARYGPPTPGFSRYLLGRPDGVYVGATARPARHPADSHPADPALLRPDRHADRWLLGVARQLAPDLPAGPAPRTLLGLRPVTPDGQPIVGPHPDPRLARAGVIVAAGHGRHGALLAPATAQAALHLLLGVPA
ncbi:NAD(P)/FAD-dependent oxidoreductase [Deinococcus knuensis]|uniref:Glycine oxidase ThiO n=1 Tax=Deinococcus knuensis TaxID=1837380 RepID=A0ABQ2SIS0_9DEIO|nr:FAD-dependent oxidoreductase [Deinococcus knuensis]GGS28588.1 glycine oxidase ThiO [Deinococcus knuensis]